MTNEAAPGDTDIDSAGKGAAEAGAEPARSSWLGAAFATGCAGLALGVALGLTSRIEAVDHERFTPQPPHRAASKDPAHHEDKDAHPAHTTHAAHAPARRPHGERAHAPDHQMTAHEERQASMPERVARRVLATKAGDPPLDSYATAARAAATAFAEGRYRVARAIYVAALESDEIPPTLEAEMRAGLAACYSRLGRKREAIEQAARAADLLLAEGSGKTLIELGDRLLERGNDVGARRRYARVLLTADGPWSDPSIEALAQLRMAVAWQHAAQREARR